MYSIRKINLSNINDVEECVNSNKMVYGVSINHKEVIDNIKTHIETGNVLGAYIDDDCVAVCTQKFWVKLPVWIMSNFYVKNILNNSYLTKNNAVILCELMEHCIKLAEEKNYYEFYYVIRDNITTDRKRYLRKMLDISTPDITKRYEFENIHILKSVNDIKWSYISDIIGNIGFKFLEKNKDKKIIIVRRGRLSRNFRETISM
jgi:hypothetical protein